MSMVNSLISPRNRSAHTIDSWYRDGQLGKLGHEVFAQPFEFQTIRKLRKLPTPHPQVVES